LDPHHRRLLAATLLSAADNCAAATGKSAGYRGTGSQNRRLQRPAPHAVPAL